MSAFVLSMMGLCVVAGFLQYWFSRRWLASKSPAYSVAISSIVAALNLQGLTVVLTLIGIVDPHTNFLSYFYQYGYMSLVGSFRAILVPTGIACFIAFIPAIAVAALFPKRGQGQPGGRRRLPGIG